MKEALITIRLRDVVTGTSTNADALPLSTLLTLFCQIIKKYVFN